MYGGGIRFKCGKVGGDSTVGGWALLARLGCTMTHQMCASWGLQSECEL